MRQNLKRFNKNLVERSGFLELGLKLSGNSRVIGLSKMLSVISSGIRDSPEKTKFYMYLKNAE